MRTRDQLRKTVLTAGAALAPGAQAKPVHVLYDFSNLSDGAYPEAGVIMDKTGNLYGTTLKGGGGACAGGGCGTVFRLAANGGKTALYSFTGGSDGSAPHGLVTDKAGNLYEVTTAGGGTGCYNNTGCGTVFEIAASGTETILHVFAGGAEKLLHTFTGGDDGSKPMGGLIMDGKGHLYNTTSAGGGGNCNNSFGCGAVFELRK